MKSPKVQSVLAVVLIKNKILLTKRRDIPIWVLPGGKIDEGESADAAVIREIREETSVPCKIAKKVCLFTSSSRFVKPVYLYLLKGEKCDLNTFDKHEVKEMGLFTLHSLPSPLAPLYKEWIQLAISESEYQEKHLPKFSIKDLLIYFFQHPIISIRFLLMRMGIHLNI